MFKKKCPHCKEKIEKKYGFCPFCGQNLNSSVSKEDYGLLGREDSEDLMPESILGGPVMDRLVKTAMGMVEKQMRNMQNEARGPKQPQNQNPFGNVRVQFSINGKRVDLPNQVQKDVQESPKKIVQNITKENTERLAKLPKKEPKSKVRRFSGKLIYELEVPGVNDIGDVLINQLENSIEIKAISKTKVYTKTLNVNFPIVGYRLNKGNLILELQAR